MMGDERGDYSQGNIKMRRTCATIGVVLAPKCQNLNSPVLIAPFWIEGIVGTSLQWLSTMCAEECSLLDGLLQAGEGWGWGFCGVIFGFSFVSVVGCVSWRWTAMHAIHTKNAFRKMNNDWCFCWVTMSQHGPWTTIKKKNNRSKW